MLVNPLIAKLRCAVQLSESDEALLEKISSPRHKIGAHEEIIGEGDRPEHVHLVLEGYAGRTKVLPSGQTPIVALLLPGDFCDLHGAILCEMDHSIRALTPCTMVCIPKQTIAELASSSSAVLQALWWATLVDEATLREWLVNMGQRKAEQQMAHLFCELFVRLRAVDLVTNDSYSFPLSQKQLANVLGRTLVHVNRVMQSLRSRKIVEWRSGRVSIPDFERLSEFAAFDPKYLHLGGSVPSPATTR